MTIKWGGADVKATSFRIVPDCYELFTNESKAVGLSRDPYIHSQLGEALDALEEGIPKPLNRFQIAKLKYARIQSAPFTKSDRFRLDTNMNARMSRVCKERGIPRDTFFEAFLYSITEYIEYMTQLGKSLRMWPNGGIVNIVPLIRWTIGDWKELEESEDDSH